MVGPEPLREQGAWWQRPLRWVSRFRQDPGTANLRTYASLVEGIVSQRASLRCFTDDDLLRRSAGSVSISLDDDDELARFLGVASEVARRRLGLEPFEVQLLAAVSMLRGRVVDMATGEGKTLVGFLVSAGLAAAGRRVHVLSANDYLAGRDADAGEPLFSAFGLTCAAVVDGMGQPDRSEAYRADVVYATVHQIGFDLLRDRQRLPEARRLVPGLDAAVVDEIDAVLLDDAMVPLVIAGDADPQPEEASLAQVIAELTEEEHYQVEGDRRSVAFTEAGIARVESALGIDDLYAQEHVELLTAAHVALHAHALVERDVHYLVTDGRVQLVNDARGRVADRQRWPDGLHAAIERKEGLEVTGQAEILDQVLVETVARGYRTLTGMSGTALEAAERLAEDLDIKTGVIPTHRPCIREDAADRLFATVEQRDTAAADAVRAAHDAGQPVLIGTGSVADSERFARLLAELGVEARVLNAKNDAAEAEIIARAGEHGAVTVSTQMAGRGVDIQLGPGAAETGGLLVIGLGRYDSARLDRQLRGRSGRQGDPGRSVFYTSLEDDVVTEQLRISDQPRSIAPDGLIGDRKFARLYEHSQRVAEGKLLQLHRTTRSYHTMTDQHRQAILDTRERLLTEPDALDDYLQQVFTDAPGRAGAWAAQRRRLATEVVLYQLDRAWTDHLNHLAAVREGIHLRVLGRQNPLDEFNRIAGDSFRSLGPDALAAVRRVLDNAPDDATTLGDLGLRRPSSTWTYMVTDNPFGSEADRVVAYLGNFIRGGRPPSITYT
ncbi:MAG: accessory Sec system translocase SecA2 [Microbacterium sp.]|uniref:accessory Sec system translocase SecA2 n=1 Tax=Micrococcales TaxID=85006 RepID=UPI001081BD72|nr:accessory Sec system translocase SecA2 [Brevibacterium sp. S111]TGD10604.1 accessory Sec system translocase SecA2 [Brevibacterium sp. S111]